MTRIAEEAAPYGEGPAQRRGKKTPIPESALWRLWQRRAARQEEFRTNRGQRVRVLYPGRPGRTAGPDFRNALLHFEELGLVQGDVEIHLRQQDWNSHGHQDDPNYNGVVLHAALDLSPSPTHLESGGQAPVVSLTPLLDGDSVPATPAMGSSLLWDVLAPLGYSRPETLEQLGELLDRAGDARFLAKSARFQKYLEEADPEQVLYEALMESLGYRQNQQPFVTLAGRAPYAALAKAAQSHPPEDRARAIQTWLLCLSGLAGDLAQPGEKLPGKTFGPPLLAENWRCFRVRPTNHPHRRITGAARLLARSLDQGLLATLTRAAAGPKPNILTQALTVVEGKETYVGPGRAREMAVNVVLPFCHARNANNGRSVEGEEFLAHYRRFGKLPDNEIARELFTLLSAPGWTKPKLNARRQQGLIHLQRLLAGAAN